MTDKTISVIEMSNEGKRQKYVHTKRKAAKNPSTCGYAWRGEKNSSRQVEPSSLAVDAARGLVARYVHQREQVENGAVAPAGAMARLVCQQEHVADDAVDAIRASTASSQRY